MVRRTSALLAAVLLAGVLLALSGFAQTGDKAKGGETPAVAKAPAGNWKVVLPLQASKDPFWLVQFEQKDGRWAGKVLATGEEVPRSELTGVGFKDGVLSFSVKTGDNRLEFEFKVPSADATKLLGTATMRTTINPAELERTALTSLDKQELNKEVIATSKDNIAVLRAAAGLVGKASFMRAKAEDVRGWMDRALKASEAYGERFQQEILLQLIEGLNDQDGLAAVTLPYARRAERLLAPKDRPALRKRTLDLLATALERAGKADEAQEVAAKAKKIEFSVAARPFPPREGKNNRVVLVELFTGAECPPCVAADLGFDALDKTFRPTEAVMLQYHEHIPGLDPLTNAHSEARMKYYQESFGRQFQGTPSTAFNGKPTAAGGGPRAAAQDKYEEFHRAVVGMLDDKPAGELKLAAVRKGDKIDITAEVADLKETGDSIRLRLVLVEETVQYKGGNGLEEHHCVVRAFPGGGAEGTALKEKAKKVTASVDLGELRTQLKKYLEEAYKKEEEPLPKDVPMEMKKLRVVAFIQDDNSREVLQAAQVAVEDAK